jgi:hypothetical protein
MKGMVDHKLSTSESTLALIETMFNIPCMKLDCSANNLLEAFNFGHRDLSRFIDTNVGTGSALLTQVNGLSPRVSSSSPTAGSSLTVTAIR